jgi:hypothetical protein
MLKNSVMYISLLDYLIEIKNKFWIIIITFILFLSLAFIYAAYKKNYYELSVQSSLLKLESLSLKGYNLRTDSKTAIKFISDTAELKFKLINTQPNLELKCRADQHFLSCLVSGRVDGKVEDLQNNMFKSVEEAFEEYRDYFVKLIDGLIVSHDNLFQYVLTNDDTDIETRARYKSHIEEAYFAKKMFLAAVNEGIPTIDEIYIERYVASNNYLVIILSSLLCSLFLIFLQMKKKEDNDR